MILGWKAPSILNRNGIITNYIIELSPRNKHIAVNLLNPTFSTPELITYNITGLSPGTEYTVRVAASTVNGTGPYTANFETATLETSECVNHHVWYIDYNRLKTFSRYIMLLD